MAFWTSDTGIDGETAVELDELDLILIDPLPPYVWFQDMADFAEGVSNLEAGRDLTQSLKGRGAFRPFRNQLYKHHPELISSWHALRDVRAQCRAVQWILDQEIIDDRAAEGFVTRHPDPEPPKGDQVGCSSGGHKVRPLAARQTRRPDLSMSGCPSGDFTPGVGC